MVGRSQCGKDTGKELQTDLDLCAVTVPAQHTDELCANSEESDLMSEAHSLQKLPTALSEVLTPSTILLTQSLRCTCKQFK